MIESPVGSSLLFTIQTKKEHIFKFIQNPFSETAFYIISQFEGMTFQAYMHVWIYELLTVKLSHPSTNNYKQSLYKVLEFTAFIN